MYKYKRNGFTLVELMAVIIIISLIALLTFPNIINQIKKTKKSNNKMIEDVVIEQAKKYVNDNEEEFQDNDGYCLSIETLVDNGYVKEELVSINEKKDNNVIMMIRHDDFTYKIVDKNDCDVQNILVDNEGKKYERVEYLESAGTQYIDTGYKNVKETKVQIKFVYLQSNGDIYSNGMIYGSANDVGGRPGLSIGIAQNDKLFYRNSDDAESYTNYSIENGEAYFTEFYKTGIIINDDEINYDMGLISNEATYTSYLFARHQPVASNGIYVNDAYSPFIGRIYYCKIYDNNILVRDYIPVIDSISRPCLFDKVSRKCYYNQGTGEFKYKYDYYDSDENKYKKVEYLESTGKQYIDTEYMPNVNTIASLKFITEEKINQYAFLFGSRSSDGKNQFGVFFNTNGNYYARYGNDTNYGLGNYSNNETKINLGKNIYEFDETRINVSGSIEKTNNIYIFGMNTGGNFGSASSYKLYGFTITENGYMLRDYVPVIDKNDRPCLFDKVSRKCYYNQGTGEFLWG